MEQIKVLTFNAWLLHGPFGINLSKEPSERLKIMGDTLSSAGADIIALQEVWGSRFRNRLIKDLKKNGYPHIAYKKITTPLNIILGYQRWYFPFFDFMRTFFGTGLMIASKFPIKNSIRNLVFKDRTKWDEIFVEKGALKIEIEIPQIGRIDVVTGHLGALTFYPNKKKYEKTHLDARHRQTIELAQWIKETSKNSNLILAIDLNCHYHQFQSDPQIEKKFTNEYLLLTSKGGLDLIDTFTHMNGFQDPPCWTFAQKNLYVQAGYFKRVPEVVADYIFLSSNSNLACKEAKIVFDEPIPRFRKTKNNKATLLMLSDHYGVMTTFELN